MFERIVTSDEITVIELTRKSGMTQSAVSQHLQSLKETGLIVARPGGRNVHYRAQPKGLAPLDVHDKACSRISPRLGGVARRSQTAMKFSALWKDDKANKSTTPCVGLRDIAASRVCMEAAFSSQAALSSNWSFNGSADNCGRVATQRRTLRPNRLDGDVG
jgi:DNA-binding transcriptional ArsR family regulator